MMGFGYIFTQMGGDMMEGSTLTMSIFSDNLNWLSIYRNTKVHAKIP